MPSVIAPGTGSTFTWQSASGRPQLNRRGACRPISDIERLFFERRGDKPLRLLRKFRRCYRHRLLLDTTVGLYRHRRCRTLARFHAALSQIQPGVFRALRLRSK